MSNLFKRGMSLLLTVVMLLSLTVPSVLAVTGTETPQSTESVTYDFVYGANNEYLKDCVDAISQAYNTLGWKFFLTDNDYGYQRSIFHAATDSLQMQNAAGNWFAFQIKAPGTGEYEMVLEHGARPRGAEEGRIYILPATADYDSAEEIDAAVGDRNGNGTSQQNATVSWYSATENVSGVTSNAFTYTFEANKDYILVFKSQTTGVDTTNAYMYASVLTATKVQQDETTGPEETTSASEETTSAPKVELVTGENAYYFYQPGYAGSYLSHWRPDGDAWFNGVDVVTEEFLASYDELNWKPETTGAIANMSNNGYLELTLGEANYYAFRVKAPATGTYDVTLNYSVTTAAKAAVSGGMYIMEATKSDSYTVAEMKTVFSETGSVLTATYKGDAAGTASATGSYSFVEGKEYIIAFSVNDGDDTATATDCRAYINNVQLVKTADYVPDRLHPMKLRPMKLRPMKLRPMKLRPMRQHPRSTMLSMTLCSRTTAPSWWTAQTRSQLPTTA